MYFRPDFFNDQIIDFKSFNQNYCNVSIGLNTTDHALQYFVNKTGKIMNNNPYIITLSGNTVMDYSVQKNDNTQRIYIFKRSINDVGLYSDNILWYNQIVNYGLNDPRYNQIPRPYLTQNSTYNYYIFQKSIISANINNNLITNGKVIMTTINNELSVDLTNSRGYELGLNCSVYIFVCWKPWETGAFLLEKKQSPDDRH